MISKPQMQDLPADKQATKAISHVLDTINGNANLGYWMGYGSQSRALMVECLATLTNQSMEKISNAYPPAQPRKLDEHSLRECPFCGGHYVEHRTDGYGSHAVHCGDCDYNGPEGNDEDEARQKWNERSIQRL